MPFITNCIQDHKSEFIPYSKFVCLCIIQIFTIYAVIMSVIGLFVALSQVDFMLIRLLADLMVNHFTTYFFLRGKSVNKSKYDQHNKRPEHGEESGDELELLDDVVIAGPLARVRQDSSLVPISDG